MKRKVLQYPAAVQSEREIETARVALRSPLKVDNTTAGSIYRLAGWSVCLFVPQEVQEGEVLNLN